MKWRAIMRVALDETPPRVVEGEAMHGRSILSWSTGGIPFLPGDAGSKTWEEHEDCFDSVVYKHVWVKVEVDEDDL